MNIFHKLSDWYKELFPKTFIDKVEDLPNPNAMVYFWLYVNVAGIAECLVQVQAKTAREWVESGTPLKIDYRDPMGDLVIIIDKDSDKVIFPKSVIAKEIPDYQKKVMSPEQYYKFLDQLAENFESQRIKIAEIREILENQIKNLNELASLAKNILS